MKMIGRLFLTAGTLMALLGTLSVADDKAPPKANPPAKLPELRNELKDMVKVDQEARQRIIAAGATADKKLLDELAATDAKNTARMKEIIAAHGWPGKSLIGTNGAHDAWLLVQHADRDRNFQRRCLDLLKEAVAHGEASGKDLAYLTDRVLLAEGKKQIYGTQ